MRYPPRLSHLATRTVIAAKLGPTYAEAHHLDDEETKERLDAGLTGSLLDDLLASTWEAMKAKARRLDDQALLEKVARTLAERPQRPGRKAKLTPAWSAFLVMVDLNAGLVSDAARRVMEGEQARKVASEGLAEAGRHLAAELTRGP